MVARICRTQTRAEAPATLEPSPSDSVAWNALASDRHRRAIRSAAQAFRAIGRVAAETQRQYIGREENDGNLDATDLAIAGAALDAERALINLILAPQQSNVSQSLRHDMARVQCRPACARVGSTLYVVVPRHPDLYPFGKVPPNFDEHDQAMILHVLDRESFVI